MTNRIAILMTCHNRQPTTLACLERLFTSWPSDNEATAQVFLVDDGSTDGTGDRVREQFSNVTVIKGNGSLYWARGMALAWRTAAEAGDWDAYLWLNDDVMLDNDSIPRLLAEVHQYPDEILLGALQDEITGDRVYGAGNDGLFTGSFVWVPRKVYVKVGILSDAYRHAWADYDYAHRCRRAGIAWRELEGTIGTIRFHPIRPPLAGRSLSERWPLLRDPKGWCLADVWTYRFRNYNVLRAVASCVNLVLHVLVWGER